MSARQRRLATWMLGPLGLIVLAAGCGALWLGSSSGGAFLADRISRAASAPGRGVVIGGIDNALSSDIILRDIALTDANGVWLRVDRVTIGWSRLALLAGRVDIDELAIGRVDVARRPLPAPAPTKPAASNGPLIPNLPVDVHLARLGLERLALAEAVAGATAEFSADGAADLAGGAASVKLIAKRLDAPGDIAADAAFDPAAKKARAKLKIAEPAGGVIARLANIPGLPAVTVDLDGDGALDDFSARLSGSAGTAIGVEGAARIVRAGAARRVTLDLNGQIAAMLPKALGPLFAGATKIELAAALPDAGGAELEKLALATSALRVDAAGKLGPDGAIDATGTLRPTPPEPGAAFRAKKLDADFHIGGALTRPDIALRMLVEDAVSPAGHFGHFDASLTATANGPPGDPATRLDIFADALGSNLAFVDRSLIDAIGEDIRLSVRARASGAGDVEVGLAKIDARAGEASFVGKAGAETLAGKLQLASPDLARLARLAGVALRGDLKLAADLTGAPAEGHVEAVLTGNVAGPGVGIDAVDGLLGRRLAISGGVRTLPGGGVGFDGLTLAGDNVRALIKGVATREAADVAATVDIPELKRADVRLTGRATASATVTGNLQKPDATFSASILNATAAGRAVPRLDLRGQATDIIGALKGSAMLNGIVDGKPAAGKLAVARVGKAIQIDGLDIAIGRASLKGALTLGETGLAAGRLTFAAPDLDDLSALALRKLAGNLSADVTLDSANGGQDVAIDARGAGIRSAEISLDRLTARLSGRDVLRRPALDGEASLDNARIGKETISKARLTAKPSGAGAALDLSVDARGFAILARGVLTPGDRSRLDLASLSAQRGAQKIVLAGPATISFGGGTVDIKGLSVGLGSGRLDLDGSVGDSLDLTARARAIPLSIVALIDASLGLEGTLDGEARIGGAVAEPSGDWKLRIARLSAPQTRSNGVPPADISASGRLAGGRTTVDATISVGTASRATVTGSAPIDGSGALDLAIKGVLDAGLANTALASNGQTLRGKANIDLRLSGPAVAPIFAGDVTLADGAFNDPLNGVALSRIAARLEARGREISVASFSAATANGGQIGLTGRASLAAENGFPGAFHITARNARLANTDVVTSTADVDLDISGPLARAPKVSGKVTLLTMEVAVPDRLPASLKPLPGTIHIDAKGFAKQMLDIERKQKAKDAERAAKKSPFDATLDLAISAPNRIFVRGRGIDAEFGGDLRLGGTLAKPNVIGGFDLRRGRLQLLTQRINLSTGKLSFTGGLTPELDFSAETTAGDVTAKIGVSGPANTPAFAFSSSPSLPQDEVLSRLLFAKASGSLSPFQAVQLATALAQFSGASTGVDAFEKMRKALGVDSLDIDASGANGPTVGASRYLTNNISVGVKTGAKPEQSSVNVGIDLSKGLRLQGETSADGKSSVGIGVEVEY